MTATQHLTRPAGIADLTANMVEMLADDAELAELLATGAFKSDGSMTVKVTDADVAAMVAHCDRVATEGAGKARTSAKALAAWLRRPAVKASRNVWFDTLMGAYLEAAEVWDRAAEEASYGYATELAMFEAENPRPRLADFMRAMSTAELEHEAAA